MKVTTNTMSIFLLVFSLTSSQIGVCSSEKALDIGVNVIVDLYPEYRQKISIFTVEDQIGNWVVLRKPSIFKTNPKEYPRAIIVKDTCKVERVLWSK